jgi:hypothetical protein
MVRFAVDDVKAYCLEAATAGAAKPSSRQLGDSISPQSPRPALPVRFSQCPPR